MEIMFSFLLYLPNALWEAVHETKINMDVKELWWELFVSLN